MAVDLSPKTGNALFDSDAGAYYAWTGANQPILKEKNLCAGRLVLKPLSLAMPHYSDSQKFAFVLEGTAIGGVVLAGESKERVTNLKKNDLIVLPLGNLTWLYNESDSDFSIILLGDTDVSVHPGDFSYFLLSGAINICNGLSTEFLTKAWTINETQAHTLFKSQPALLVTKLKEKLQGIKPHEQDKKGIAVHVNSVRPEVEVKNAGHVITITSANISTLKEAGFCVSVTKLEPKAMRSPGFGPDAAVQEIYVMKGSGHVQIVGTNGLNVVNQEVKEGSLFVVPSLFVLSVVAGSEGMEWISLIKTSKPFYHCLTGKSSFFNILTPQVLQAALGADSELVNDLKAKGGTNGLLIPPPKE
ncbi:hypothetical protein LUZ60_011981 [Juncus effusus]|nr:hypothetical protein LUZ60_011981 [Juncus effusus]